MRYCIIQPILSTYRLSLEFPFIYFAGLVISVVFIAAAGYLINDYFDVQADTINRPEKVIIGKYVNHKTALRIYYAINLIALAISFYISFKIKNISLFIIFPVTVGLLWFYSTTYKRQLLTGNILISLIVASVPFLVALYDISPVVKNNHEYIITYNINFYIIFTWIGGFALFAFLVNLIRELIKDAEDFAGDKLYGRSTLPVVTGMVSAKIVITGLSVLTLSGLGFIYYNFLRLTHEYDSTGTETGASFDVVTFLYFLLLLFIPFLLTIYIIIAAKEKKQYSLASSILKFVMVTGVLFSIIVKIKVG